MKHYQLGYNEIYLSVPNAAKVSYEITPKTNAVIGNQWLVANSKCWGSQMKYYCKIYANLTMIAECSRLYEGVIRTISFLMRLVIFSSIHYSAQIFNLRSHRRTGSSPTRSFN